MRTVPNLLVATGLLALAPTTLLAAPCTTTINTGTSIQATIDSATAGDVICLNAGNYQELAKIFINKSITLQGPQAGVDPRPLVGSSRVPNGAGEAIIDGTGSNSSGNIRIDASNVVIDGLQISNNSGDLVDADSVAVSNVIIRNNIVSNSSGDEGIQLKDSTDALIENNYIFDIGGDGINVSSNSTGAVIQYNQLADIRSTNAAIYLYQQTNALVLTNYITNSSVNDGIKIGIKGGGDSGVNGGTVMHNRVSNTAEDGISVYSSNVLVQGNAITGSNSRNGALYVTYDVDGTTINSNTIVNNSALGVLIGAQGLYPTNTIANENCIAGNTGGGMVVFFENGGTLDATNNWWGAADGPSGQGAGSGDSVGSNIDFSSFQVGGCTLLDPDNDGIFSKFDNCPDVFNERQENTDPETPEGDACSDIPGEGGVNKPVPVNNPLALLLMMLMLAGLGWKFLPHRK